MKKKPSLLMQLLRNVTFALSFCFLFLLFAMSGISMCTMRSDYQETTFFISSNILLKMVLLAMVLFFFHRYRCRIISKLFVKLDTDVDFLNRTRKIMTLVLFMIAAIWVCLTRPTVISDQSEILTAAEQMNYHDFSCVRPGGYAARHPHQIGSVLVAAFLQKIVGRDNYLFFQMMNAAMAALCYYCLSLFAGQLKMSGTMQIVVFILGILFFPFLFYATFVYATIPALLFSLIAFALLACYEQKTGNKKLVFCVLSIAFAIFLKQNSLIFAIAMFIYLVISAFQQKRGRAFIFPAFLLAMVLMVMFLPKVFMEKLTGVKMVDGISPYAYLTMGAQDGDRAPGWYNMYINITYDNSGYDAGKQKIIAWKDFTERIAHFKADPLDWIRFILQKTASEWNNPTFEAFWINRVRGSVIEPAGWIDRITMPVAVDKIAKYLNPLQYMLWLLVLISLLNRKKDCPDLFYLPLLTFVGGFIFHSIWEAKCQYTLPYFVMLFPYAAEGICSLRTTVCRPREALITILMRKKAMLILGTGLFLILSIVLVHSGYITGDTNAYADYLAAFVDN